MIASRTDANAVLPNIAFATGWVAVLASMLSVTSWGTKSPAAAPRREVLLSPACGMEQVGERGQDLTPSLPPRVLAFGKVTQGVICQVIEQQKSTEIITTATAVLLLRMFFFLLWQSYSGFQFLKFIFLVSVFWLQKAASRGSCMQPHCIFSSFPFLPGQLKGPEKRLADPYWSLVVPIKYKSKGLNIGCVSYQRISIQAHTVEDVLRLRCAAFAKMFKLQKWIGFWYCSQLQGSPDVLVPWCGGSVPAPLGNSGKIVLSATRSFHCSIRTVPRCASNQMGHQLWEKRAGVSRWQGCGGRKSQQARRGDQRQGEEMGLCWRNCGEEMSDGKSVWGWRFVHAGSVR